MATSTVDTTTPQPPGPWDDAHPGKRVFIPDSSGVKKEMAVLTYDIRPEKVQEFQTFFKTDVLPFYKRKGATDVHSFMVGNRLFVLGTKEVNVPWLNSPPQVTDGIAGLEKFVVTTAPPTINELPAFP